MFLRSAVLALSLLIVIACQHQPRQGDPRLLVENVYILTLEQGQSGPVKGYLLVDHKGVISELSAGKPPVGLVVQRRLDAQGQWLLPGFVSAHSHLWQSGFYGIAANDNLEGWIDRLYGVEAPKLDAAQLYQLTRRGATQHLQNGITSVFNFTYTGADRSGEVDRQQLRGALDAGLRVVHGLNVRTVNESWTPAMARERTAAFLAWASAQPESGRYLGAMLAGAAGYVSATPGQAQVEGDLMREFFLGNQQHYLESVVDSAGERARYPLLEQAGIAGPRLIFGHFIHSTPELTAMAVRAGVGMTWNPMSNGRLGSGMADVLAYRAAGMKVGMGVDGEASADRADPFENMRMGLYQVRAGQQRAAAMQAYEVLRLHTLGSAEVLGIDTQVGSLKVGKRADMLLLDPRAFTPWQEPYAALVFAAGVKDIREVFVDGVSLAR
jgi:cytosine/adenosine deaminase-related metal-dependent hydrolase